MTEENFRIAAKIMNQRGDLIKQRDWCGKLINNFEGLRYSLNFPMEPTTTPGRYGTCDRLEVYPDIVKEMLEKNFAWLDSKIEDLTDQLEEL